MKILILVIVIVIGVASLYSLTNRNNGKDFVEQSIQTKNKKMTLYKSPNCGCCVGYAEELTRQGFEIEIIATDDMDAVKEKYNIPDDKQSCHTVIIDNYFIEGHVPIEAVNKLLEERPEIEGIGLPRMPAGTPGMPGQKQEPYEIYKSINGEFLEYLTI